MSTILRPLVKAAFAAALLAVSVPAAAVTQTAPAVAATLPPYVIGPEDRLSIVFFKEPDMSMDVVVGPDGMISLPLLHEMTAAGLTPAQLRERIVTGAKRFVQEPNPAVIVREIHSRRVFITGAVEHPGVYPLNAPMTVLQLIAAASGLKEYADSKNIAIVRYEDGQERAYAFNYQDVVARRDLTQDLPLRPGDMVIVR